MWCLIAAPAQADESFDLQVRDALLRNPEIVLEVFAILEKRQDERAAARDQALLRELAEELFGALGGTDEAGQKPVLIEFVDYNCSYCRRAEAEVTKALAANPEIELRLLQLPILGPSSVDAARMAYAAKLTFGDETYRRINDALLQGGAPAMSNLDAFLDEMGFDVAALRAASLDPRVDEHLETTHGLARRLGITGTPGFVTRTAIHRGFVGSDELIESALRPATAEGRTQ